ncbi:MAG: glycosyltransferase family 4 protein [Bacteroidia bacterium]
MRILQLSVKSPLPAHDGGSLAMANFFSLWKALGYQARTLAIASPKHPIPAEVVDQSPFPITLVPVDTTPRFLRALKNFFSAVPYHVVRFTHEDFADALKKIVHTWQPDIIQLETPYLAQYRDLFGKSAIVYRMHNIESQIWFRQSAHMVSPAFRLYLRRQAARIAAWEKEVLSWCDGLLPISHKEAHWAQALGYQGPITVLPFGLPVENYPFSPPLKTPPTLAFIGALDWLPNQKGLVWFLRNVWAPFKKAHPTAHFFVAGRNAPPSLLRFADPQTHILGEVADARAFLAEHDILVVPLFAGSGIRIKILEGWAMGKAILTTPIGAESLTYEDQKNIMIASDASSFFAMLHRLYEDVHLRIELAYQGRKLVETHYNLSSLIPIAKKFYEAVHGIGADVR